MNEYAHGPVHSYTYSSSNLGFVVVDHAKSHFPTNDDVHASKDHSPPEHHTVHDQPASQTEVYVGGGLSVSGVT